MKKHLIESFFEVHSATFWGFQVSATCGYWFWYYRMLKDPKQDQNSVVGVVIKGLAEVHTGWLFFNIIDTFLIFYQRQRKS